MGWGWVSFGIGCTVVGLWCFLSCMYDVKGGK
jgi:hypothetical protein